MIGGVGSVAVLVNDQNKSAQWYRDKLGFEVVEKRGHTVFVRAQGSETLIHLCGDCEAWGTDKPVGRTGIWLSCSTVRLEKDASDRILPSSDPDQVEMTYRELKDKGVEFSEDLKRASWGCYAVLKDPDGNEFELS